MFTLSRRARRFTGLAACLTLTAVNRARAESAQPSSDALLDSPLVSRAPLKLPHEGRDKSTEQATAEVREGNAQVSDQSNAPTVQPHHPAHAQVAVDSQWNLRVGELAPRDIVLEFVKQLPDPNAKARTLYIQVQWTMHREKKGV
jgi:hypothetical protein